MNGEGLSLEQQAIIELSNRILRLDEALRENTRVMHLMVDELKRRAKRDS